MPFNNHGINGCSHNVVFIIFSLTLIFQIFLKVAEESGVDAETSGNPPGGAAPSQGCASCRLS